MEEKMMRYGNILGGNGGKWQLNMAATETGKGRARRGREQGREGDHRWSRRGHRGKAAIDGRDEDTEGRRPSMGAMENIMNKEKRYADFKMHQIRLFLFIFYTQKTYIICEKEKKSLSLHLNYIHIACNLYDIQFISISVGLPVAFRGILHDSFVEESFRTYP